MSVDAAPRPDQADRILERVEGLTEAFRRRLPLTEAARSIPRESVDDLRDAGLARMLVPREHGGLGLRIRDAVDTATVAASGCASTGWVSWLMMHVPHVVAAFPVEAQDAVWAQGPDVVTAGSHVGMTVETVAGGYRLSGRGAFTSGVNNADWVYVGGMMPAVSGPPQPRYFLLQRGQYTVADTWDTVGMRGTGSNTVVVDDLFVPEAFTLAHSDAREGTGPGTLANASPTLRLPWVAKGSLGFIATILGAAQAARDTVIAALAGKKLPSGARAADSEVLQQDVGLVTAKLDAAQALLRGLADRADAGGSFTLAERAASSRTGAFITTLVVESVDTLLELAGTSGFSTTSVVQQSWRDIHFAAAHISLAKKEPLAAYGRLLLGVQKPPGMFF